MSREHDLAELVECVADERLLAEDMAQLPDAVGRPEAIVPVRARGRIVALGATLTGVSLLAGAVLIVVALIAVISQGFGGLSIAALVAGVTLVATHWGWVHVAELTANAIEGRSNADALARRRQWLQTIKPYVRYEVKARTEDDGSISLVSLAYRPVVTAGHRFTFVRETVRTEVHSADEPAAKVAERAETLRREAAIETERERGRFERVADAYETALLGTSDEQQRVAARRAASAALSEQINAHLRDPPLVE